MYTQWADQLGPTFKIKSAWLVRRSRCFSSHARCRLTDSLSIPTRWSLRTPSLLGTSTQRFVSLKLSLWRGLTKPNQNTFNYHHSPVFSPLIERIIGKGLVWVEEQSGNQLSLHRSMSLKTYLEHRRMRAIVAPAFSLDNVRNMNDDIWSIASTLQTKLSAHIAENTAVGDEKSGGGGGVLVDLIDWSAAASLDVIGRCGFKHDFRFGETPEGRSILAHWRAQVSAGMLPSAFLALVVLRTFPRITALPIPAIQAQGAIKTTVRALAQRLVGADNLARNTDVLSLLRASCPRRPSPGAGR